jgi:hypothetical protein
MSRLELEMKSNFLFQFLVEFVPAEQKLEAPENFTG